MANLKPWERNSNIRLKREETKPEEARATLKELILEHPEEFLAILEQFVLQAVRDNSQPNTLQQHSHGPDGKVMIPLPDDSRAKLQGVMAYDSRVNDVRHLVHIAQRMEMEACDGQCTSEAPPDSESVY